MPLRKAAFLTTLAAALSIAMAGTASAAPPPVAALDSTGDKVTESTVSVEPAAEPVNNDGRFEPRALDANGKKTLNIGNGRTLKLVANDDGRSLTVTGTATGLDPKKQYVSLLYGDQKCTTPLDNSAITFTLDGVWQNAGDGTRTLKSVYKGLAYKAPNGVDGRVAAISLREVTNVVGGTGDFTVTLAPIACAPISKPNL